MAGLLAGCAAAPAQLAAPERALFTDAAFKPPADMVTPEQLFALTPEMKAFANKLRQNLLGNVALHTALFEALRTRNNLRLEYDSEQTRTAAQAFEARSGNCLSLVLMTAAFARELGLPTNYQRITSDNSWSRSGSVYFSSGHVNLLLGKSGNEAPTSYDRSNTVIIDFLSPPDAEKLPSELIPEKRVVAMFMNNRAAETLLQGKLDDAYWWARSAIEHDPGYLLAYNTLAMVYQKRGAMPQAERTLRFAHQHDPLNQVILANLADVAAATGKPEDAAKFKAELARLDPTPQFIYFHQGQQAMAQGDFRKARTMFARELKRAPHYHEFHFWMAKAAFALGDLEQANKHMELALSNSTTRDDTAIYAGKLAHLRLMEVRRGKPH